MTLALFDHSTERGPRAAANPRPRALINKLELIDNDKLE